MESSDYERAVLATEHLAKIGKFALYIGGLTILGLILLYVPAFVMLISVIVLAFFGAVIGSALLFSFIADMKSGDPAYILKRVYPKLWKIFVFLGGKIEARKAGKDSVGT